MDDEVFVGFVETLSDDELSFTDSKVGGKPLWLWHSPPPFPSLLCPQCQNPMPLLLQIYAPLDWNENAYHRILYIFCCSDGRCHHYYIQRNQISQCFKVLRSQLPASKQSPPFHNQYCHVCNGQADKRCSKCKDVWYCSKYHQLSDWKAGHRTSCQQEKPTSFPPPLNFLALQKCGVHFPEYEIETEKLSDFDNNTDTNTSHQSPETLSSNPCPDKVSPNTNTSIGSQWREIEQYQKDTQDPTWRSFQKAISSAPDQILRYGGAQPIWVQTEGQPPPPPPCPHCHSNRKYEFQVLPQLLYSLNVESVARSVAPETMEWTKYVLDWGTLAVFCCEKSCLGVEEKNGETSSSSNNILPYIEEYIWIQYHQIISKSINDVD
jgi:pre-rRNA-processing protein TSR4